MATSTEINDFSKPNKYDEWFNLTQNRNEARLNDLYEIKGFPFPINRNDPRGFFYRAINHEVVKSDLLQLLLTEPGERVMLPFYGTGLRRAIFDQKDSITMEQLRSLIINAIDVWEPRIVVHSVSVRFGDEPRNSNTNRQDERIIVYGDNVDANSFIINIDYSLKENLEGIESLVFRINYTKPYLD